MTTNPLTPSIDPAKFANLDAFMAAGGWPSQWQQMERARAAARAPRPAKQLRTAAAPSVPQRKGLAGRLRFAKGVCRRFAK